jgi:hypothetical protein
MSTQTPFIDNDEIGRLGDEIIGRNISPNLSPQDDGKFIAVDVLTRNYELDESDIAAVTRLLDRIPAANVWLARIGEPAAYKIRRS